MGMQWKLNIWLMNVYGNTGVVVGEFDGESNEGMVNLIVFL